jgi:hypothetical protein
LCRNSQNGALVSNVAVLMGQSLLAQGIVSRLRQSAPALEVEVVDIDLPDVFERLASIQPRTLIVEADAMANSPYCTFDSLFQVFPNLTVIEVRLDTPKMQLIQSGQVDSSGFGDLLQILERSNANLPGAASSSSG